MEKLLRVKHQRLLVQSLLLLSSSSFGKEKDHHLMIKMETQLSLKEEQKEHHLKEPEHHLKEQEHHHKGQETEEDNQQLVQEVHHLKDNLLSNKDD